MRLFGVEQDGTFQEFVKTPFQSDHQESVLEEWLENNPDGIVEDGKLLMIGRQVITNLNSVIDLLAVDRQGNVAVIELKRDRTPRETLAQALEYASFIEGIDWKQLEEILRSYTSDEAVSLAEYHREYYELDPDEAVSFNKDQRIVIVGQAITEEIRQTATFLRNKSLRVTCVEFSFFEADGGARMLSHDIVVGKEPIRATRISSGSLPIISKDQFLESLDENGRPVFKRVLGFAQSRALPIRWGTKGFSLNVDLDGVHVVVWFCFPPSSVFKQSVYTDMFRGGGVLSKVDISEDTARSLLSEAQATGLFQPANMELKCVINREFSESEIESLLDWAEKVVATIQSHGLRE